MSSGPLNLKQRLAALNISVPNSMSGGRFGSPSSTTPKWRPTFGRRNTVDGAEGMLGQDRIQEVMARVVFQAGVDYETRPMVIMNASALPDPKEVSYDLLLSRILAYLDLYVESDYTVVFFAAGGRYTPGWNWVWKAYRSLSRKYRKNLKRLIIVHSNFFTKMLFSLASAIVSPKFFRKVAYTNTLSELASQVPITQIDIPPAVYKENLKYEDQITMPISTRADLFGVPLEEIMGYNGEKGGLPRVIRDSILFLRAAGMEQEGLFRRSASESMLKQVKSAYDRGHVVTLESYSDPHLAAVLIKKYMKELPQPLFPETVYPHIQRCPPTPDDASDMSSIIYVRETLLPELPHCSYILLSHVFHLLHEVSLRSGTNLMDAYNLAICVTPTLVRSKSIKADLDICRITGGPSMSAAPSSSRTLHPLASSSLSEGANTLGNIIVLCIRQYYEIFDELRDRTEAQSAGDDFSTHREDSASHSSSPSLQSRFSSNKRDSSFFNDDEDIDDEMLVMPLGPNAGGSRNAANGSSASSPPSAWAPGAGPGTAKYKPRHRATKSRDSRDLNAQTETARSMHTTGAIVGVKGGGYPSGRAKSTISIEKGGPFGTARRGSIAIGRGTTRKGSGSAVEATGVTANGFFTPPSSAPPVPSPPRQ